MVTMVRTVVCLCLWMTMCQVRGSYVSGEMNRTIQNLLRHYSVEKEKIFDGKPVFTREAPSSKMEAKMFFMGGILDTYEKLLGRMLKQLPVPSPQTAVVAATPGTAANPGEPSDGDIKTQLTYILKKVQELKEHHYREQEKVLLGLQSLRHIQMDNLVVQNKALRDLPWFYEEASSLPEDIEKMQKRRRRRRQAQRFKSHARA